MAKPNRSDSPLTARQENFVAEYLRCGNASQAAIRSGYSEKTAKEHGYRTLNKPNVAKAVAEARKNYLDALNIDAASVIGRIDLVANEAIEAKDRPAALRGLELLGKHLGLFKERHELSGPNGGAIEVSDVLDRIARRLSGPTTERDPDDPADGAD